MKTLYLFALPVSAGGYAPETGDIVVPAGDDGALIAAGVMFALVMAVGIIALCFSKRRDRGADDK